jgi:hypothetical protein
MDSGDSRLRDIASLVIPNRNIWSSQLACWSVVDVNDFSGGFIVITET